MRGLLDRLGRLEAAGRLLAHDLTKEKRTALAADIERVLGLAPPGTDLEGFYRETLARLDSGLGTDEDLARIGGVNLEILRLVSRLEASY